VPLVVSWPGGGVPRGARVDEPVELVDLYPTLRSWLAPDRAVPGLEGRSLLSQILPRPAPATGDRGAAPSATRSAAPIGSGTEAEGPRYAFSEAGGGSPTTHFRNVQDRRWKLIYHPRLAAGARSRPPSWELYDLAADPGETRDLVTPGDDGPQVAPEHAAEMRRLRGVLNGWMKGSEWIRMSAEDREAHSQETLKALKALGYLE
jgi:arylsulfatase A-like enzyme